MDILYIYQIAGDAVRRKIIIIRKLHAHTHTGSHVRTNHKFFNHNAARFVKPNIEDIPNIFFKPNYVSDEMNSTIAKKKFDGQGGGAI